ncbi:MAG: hypothetical protein J6386_22485 [Candidatus Synoicihabitans palmerolidicus]|nr:hypothetical protein [Candidatus Synoicihabitans palmerolidicus]
MVAFAGVPLIWLAVHHHLYPPTSALAISGVMLLFTFLAIRLRTGVAFATASVLGFLVTFYFFTHHAWMQGEPAVMTLTTVVLLVTVFAGQPLVGLRFSPWVPAPTARLWRIAHVVMAGLLITRFSLD